jgi:hypothetical protein
MGTVDTDQAAEAWARHRIVFQTGGAHGLTWQIVHLWANPDKSFRVLYVGREIGKKESLRRPPLDMRLELQRCIHEEYRQYKRSMPAP